MQTKNCALFLRKETESKKGDGEFKFLEKTLFSSSPIPGNEKMVNNVINKLIALGANVIYNQLEQVHASGHCQDELRIIFSNQNSLCQCMEN